MPPYRGIQQDGWMTNELSLTLFILTLFISKSRKPVRQGVYQNLLKSTSVEQADLRKVVSLTYLS